MGWYVIVGSLPIVIVGYLARDLISGPLRSLWWVAAALIGWSFVMVAAERLGSKARPLEKITFVDALVMGLVQCLALIPGISRSGATISAGLFRGLRRVAATRISFLLGIPALVGAGAYELQGRAERRRRRRPVAGRDRGQLRRRLRIDRLAAAVRRPPHASRSSPSTGSCSASSSSSSWRPARSPPLSLRAEAVDRVAPVREAPAAARIGRPNPLQFEGISGSPAGSVGVQATRCMARPSAWRQWLWAGGKIGEIPRYGDPLKWPPISPGLAAGDGAYFQGSTPEPVGCAPRIWGPNPPTEGLTPENGPHLELRA